VGLVIWDLQDYKLAVKGDAGIEGRLECRAVKVTMVNLADYVFHEDYNLKSIEEVEGYIESNGHLPNVPSAGYVAENGMDLGEMQNILLEKIEELTLYIIDQQKEIDGLKKDFSEIRK